MTAEAAAQARACINNAGGHVLSIRWILTMVMINVIRCLTVRFVDLSNIRLSHLSVIDDFDSPLGAAYSIHLPKSKNDILGTSGGANSELL